MIQIRFLFSSIAVAAMASIANANLIVNGSFEDPDLGTTGSSWGLFTSIPGWSRVGAPSIEIGWGGVYGITGYHLDQVLEVDSNGNSIVQQILGTSSGASYDLSFGVARRSGVAAASCIVEVWWNGALLTSITPSSLDTDMDYYSYVVTGGVSGSTLEFRGAGTADSLGGLVDNVILTPQAVPEPMTMILAAAATGFGVRQVRKRKLSLA